MVTSTAAAASSANSTPMRDCYRSHRSTPSTTPDLDLDWETRSTSSSSSYRQSDSGSEADSSPESTVPGDAEGNTGKGDSDTELDSEGEEIMRDIAECKLEGPAKPKHKPQTVKLWKREGEFWNR